MSIFKDIKLLLTFGLKNGLIGKYDKIIARNEILHLLRLDDWENVEYKEEEIPAPLGIVPLIRMSNPESILYPASMKER